MSFIQHGKYRVIFTFILFISIKFCYTQQITSRFRPSHVEITPISVIINSTSKTNFTCVDYELSGKKLEADLSKPIPSDQIKLTQNDINKTAINIQLEANNYVGIFHLLCYTRGEKAKGTRADVIVKAAPGVLQLAERCRVYDKQYIKCLIRAPTIARAIQNDYPPKFEFREVSQSPDHLAYISRVEFLKKESTNDTLVFKWKPTVDGEFPDRVRMHMKAMLSHFNESSYYFDMTPIFRITPRFILQALSPSEVQIKYAPADPPGFCEKSMRPKFGPAVNRTWRVFDSNQNTFLVDNLLSDSLYEICFKCRQIYTDPDGAPECQEIKTLSKPGILSDRNHFVFITIIFVLVLLMVFGVLFHYWQRRKKVRYEPVNGDKKKFSNILQQNPYDCEGRVDGLTASTRRTSEDSPQDSAEVDVCDDDTVIADTSGKYVAIASIGDFMEMCAPPKVLSPHEN